jgi:predicted Zn-dependent protease
MLMSRAQFLVVLLPFLATAQSLEQEVALGKQLSANLESKAKVISDPAITGYVDRIAQEVVASAILRTPLTTKVISGAKAYAITLPGGFCYVHSTLILDAANEAELAGVIAHQIGHLAIWRYILNPDPGGIPLIFMGGGLCVRGTSRESVAMGVAIPIGLLATTRDTESRADVLGLEYMEHAGYDPGALVDFYEGVLGPGSTRSQANLIRNRRAFVVTTSAFDDIRRRVKALSPAPAPASDSIERPSLKKTDAGH